VLVGLALVTALEAGLLLVLGGAVVAAEDVAAGGDEGVELRVAARLEATLLTADDRLPLELHAATSQVITTIRLAKTTHVFLTLAPSSTDGVTSASSVRGQSQAERHPGWVTRLLPERTSSRTLPGQPASDPERLTTTRRMALTCRNEPPGWRRGNSGQPATRSNAIPF
jgi:hypothetical protein